MKIVYNKKNKADPPTARKTRLAIHFSKPNQDLEMEDKKIIFFSFFQIDKLFFLQYESTQSCSTVY